MLETTEKRKNVVGSSTSEDDSDEGFGPMPISEPTKKKRKG